MIEVVIENKISASFLLKHCIDNHLQIALSVLPNDNLIDIHISENLLKINDTYELFEKSGFVISPFSYNENSDIFLIEPQYQYKYKLDFLTKPEKVINEINFEKINLENKKQELLTTENETLKKNHNEIISNIITEIRNENVKKVVFAKQKKVKIDANFDIFDNYIKLCNKNTNAFNTLIYTSIHGIWIGSSPEILVSVDDNQNFKTVALAGTKSVQNVQSNTSEAQWTQKEIHEQALVSRYIVDCFKKIRVREYEENGPKTVQAGPLWHLKSEFVVDLKTINFENLPAVMLKLLNPTSAVCGMPKEKAIKLIQSNEDFLRNLYAGYIGLVNFGNDNKISQVYVNLRCASITNEEIHFYAGAGITEDSIPEAENDEIHRKMQVLANIFNINL